MVTWRALICVAGIIIGGGVTATSVFAIFAEGMSDAPSEGPGCTWPLVGLGILAVSIAGLVL